MPPFFSGSSQMVGSEIEAHAPRSTHLPFECADVFVPAGSIPFHDGLGRAQERKFGESPIQPDEEKWMKARRIMGNPSSHSDYTPEELAEYRRARLKKAQRALRVGRRCYKKYDSFVSRALYRSSILSESGELLEVPSANWAGLEFNRMVRTGETSVLNGSGIVTERVLLALQALDGDFRPQIGPISAP